MEFCLRQIFKKSLILLTIILFLQLCICLALEIKRRFSFLCLGIFLSAS